MADEKNVNSPDEDISDSELDQIIQDMSKEEEQLESAATPTPSPAPAAAPVASKASPAPNLSVVSNAAPAPKAKANGVEQALTLELTGVINLKLCFASGDRSIEVICGEEALICRMADGTEFRIPTGLHKARKAA